MTSTPALLLLALGLTVVQGQLRLFNLRATDLPSDLLGTTDGYVKVYSGSEYLGKTAVRKNDPDPWWEEEFTHFKAKEGDELKLEVFDQDLLFDDLVGVCQRQMKLGTYTHDCYLEKGGVITYSYTLDNINQ
ncbi:Perforin-1 [Oryzias melastigma]|uniref:Perforin-1 n=1 Tax=Oryzias melastigma TaxID=30732 RepID=A0A3B3D155_ORYME|nr:synaptotagmin-3 [Oryzias melastigma]KAF6737502.1 Perforin-1 [Oryzias melastigma]